MDNYQDVQALIAPKGLIDEYKMTIATLPRHSFREDGKIPRFDTEFAHRKGELTCDVRFSMCDDEDTNANPEISFKIEDFIRKRLGKWEAKSNFSLEFNLMSDLSGAIGFDYKAEDIEFALEKILNTNFRIKSTEVENHQTSTTQDLFCLIGGYEMHGVTFDDGEEEIYVKANITPVYADILKNSDLDPFERRMLDRFSGN